MCSPLPPLRLNLRRWLLLLVLLAPLLPGSLPANAASGAPSAVWLRVHPENPRYFLWQDRATVLVGSGEHYGAMVSSTMPKAPARST